MPLLKGPKYNGVIQINHAVKFNNQVQSTMFQPWGEAWYVDDENGSDNKTGRGPADAKATVQAAVTASDEDDVIYVRAVGAVTDASDFDYYPEQVTVPYAKTNLAIVGVTRHMTMPYLGPWLRCGYSADAITTGHVLLNYAPGLCLENMGFQAGDNIRASGEGAVYMYASTTGGAYTTHAGSVGFSVYNCFIRDGNFDIEGGYDGVVEGCHFRASGNSSASWRNKSSVLPSGGHQLLDSHFSEMFNDNQLTMYVYGVAGAHRNMLIKDCTFGLVPADNHYLWFGGTNTGLVSKCFFQHAGVSVGSNDTDDELYTADTGAATGVKFAGCWDQGGTLGDT